MMLHIDWSAFLEGIFRPPKVTTGTMAPMEGANLLVGPIQDCSHCLVAYCHHGYFKDAPTSGFCHLHPTPPPIPPNPARSVGYNDIKKNGKIP